MASATKTTWLEEDEQGKKRNGAAGMLAHGAFIAVCGATVVGVGSSVFGKRDVLQALGNAYDVGGGSISSLTISGFIASILIGAAMIGLGLLEVGSNFLRSRFLAVALLGATVVLSAIQIASGYFYLQLIQRSEDVILPNAYNANFDAEETALVNLPNALHNLCCFGRFNNDSSVPEQFLADIQQEIKACPSTPGLSPTDILVCEPLPQVLASIPGVGENFCTCFDSEVYFKVEAHVNAQDLCTVLEGAEVSDGIMNLTIPSAGGLSLSGALATTQYANYRPIENMAMTGYLPPVNPPSKIVNGVQVPTLRGEGEEGFNCGFGNVKGIVWIQHLYLAENQTIATVLMAIGAVQIIASILVMVFWCIGNSDEESWMDYEERVTPDRKQSF